MTDEDFEEDFYEDVGADGGADEVHHEDVKGLLSNPIVKIGAVILVLGGLVLGYKFMPKDSAEDAKIVLRVGGKSNVKFVPGQENLDPAFKKALEESNEREADLAAKTGGSALPAPIGTDKNNSENDASTIDGMGKSSSLDEWRRSSKKKRTNVRSMNEGDYGSGENTDCVPDLDQCVDLLKKSGMLADVCKEQLQEMGLLDKMCEDVLSQNGMLGDMKVRECKKLLSDSGLIGPDGKILDGALADNQNMTDASGVLSGKNTTGALGYDENGKPTVYKDGDIIRDKFGNVVLDENGTPMVYEDGKFLKDKDGNLVLDKNGRPIPINNMKDGECVDDGYLRDKDCNLILGPDGKPILKGDAQNGFLRDANGNLILDKNGNPIPVNGRADGFLRDANGNLILDKNGNPIPINNAENGKCVDDGYLRDKNCNLILGPDGKPILKNGKADGFLRDANGNLILDENGNPIATNNFVNGKCIDDGYLRDEKCNLILGPDGKPMLKNGLGLGSGMNSGMEEGMVNFVDPSKAGQAGTAGGYTPEQVQALTKQMMAILETKVPEDMKQVIITTKESPYQEKLRKDAEAETAASKGASTTSSGSSTTSNASSSASGMSEEEIAKQALAMPGDIFYAQTITEVNSDVPGLVMALVLTGPFTGGKAIGKFTLEEEHLVLEFESIIKDDVTYPVEAVALDQNTSLPAMATDVNHHYITRILIPFAAKFLEGYSKAIVETGTTTKTDDSGTDTTENPEPDATESLYSGFEEASGVIVDELDASGTPAVTVKIQKGTTFGLMVISKVTVGSAR